MLLSTILWGATLCSGGRRFHRTNCLIETDLSVLWPTLIPWFLLGPVFLGGSVIFLWFQRNDRI
ncbi:hypothetical protein ACLBWX_07520 [Methylobacterium sp. M6A4_1b]